MEYQTILMDLLSDHIGVIRLNRPDQLNTFSTQMADELYQALMHFEGAPEVRVIVLKGEGRAFCAGIDVNELSGKSTMAYREWIERMERPLVSISKMKTPVIAQVQGVAAANGMGLVASVDIAIAATNVKMGLTAINVGLNCVGPVIPVARCVGRKRAMELLLYGRLIKADEALSMGLINKVVSQDALEDEVMAWAKALAEKVPLPSRSQRVPFTGRRIFPMPASLTT